MKLFLIHGAPATGKLTVAQELSKLTGVPLVDNHAAIDVARMVFGFAEPGFWDLVHDLRVTTLKGAARAGVARLITTAAYSHPVDEKLLKDYDRAIAPYNGIMEPIFLSCAEATLMDRVSEPDRVKKGKLASPEGLRRYLDGNTFVAIPRSNCLQLSTEHASAQDNAAKIADHFDIPLLEAK